MSNPKHHHKFHLLLYISYKIVKIAAFPDTSKFVTSKPRTVKKCLRQCSKMSLDKKAIKIIQRDPYPELTACQINFRYFILFTLLRTL